MKNNILLTAAFLLLAGGIAFAQETVDVIKVHGIVEISEEEVLTLAGIKPGDKLTDEILESVKSSLLDSGKFSSVQVLKRHRSLTDSSKVAIVIMVEESKSIFNRFMFLPVAGFSDSGKFVYGGIVGATDLLGFGEHISAPIIMEGSGFNTVGLTAIFDSSGPLFSRVTVSAMKTINENEHFNMDDERTFANVNFARRIGPLFLSLNGGYEEVKFMELEGKYFTYGGEATFDTRRDLLLPSNAVYLSAGWQRYNEKDGDNHYDIQTLDVRAFKSLIGRSLIGGQVFYQKTNSELPDYFRPYLGGTSLLRGYEEGSFLGDDYFLAAAEIRVPFTDPDDTSIAGIHAFYNVGKIAFHGEDLWDSKLKKGAGLGVFWFQFGMGIRLDIASDLDGKYVAHLGSAFTF